MSVHWSEKLEDRFSAAFAIPGFYRGSIEVKRTGTKEENMKMDEALEEAMEQAIHEERQMLDANIAEEARELKMKTAAADELDEALASWWRRWQPMLGTATCRILVEHVVGRNHID